METYISILRGINVSGQKQIKMADLIELYQALGFINVKTYIQSGNVLFQSKISNVETLSENIQNKISEKYGFEVPVIIRTQKEIGHIININPFLKENGIDLSKLHVTFLDQIPDHENVQKIKESDFKQDIFIIIGKDIFLYCPINYGNTKLNNTFFEKKLKVKATTRNWKTVNELLRMVSE